MAIKKVLDVRSTSSSFLSVLPSTTDIFNTERTAGKPRRGSAGICDHRLDHICLDTSRGILRIDGQIVGPSRTGSFFGGKLCHCAMLIKNTPCHDTLHPP